MEILESLDDLRAEIDELDDGRDIIARASAILLVSFVLVVVYWRLKCSCCRAMP
jgi:hypothetical protein